MKTLEKKYSVAAFIDILGYKEMILKESPEKEMERFIDLKQTIDFALELASEVIKASIDFLDKSPERLSKRLNIKQFSDNIYFSFDYPNNDETDMYFGIYVITTISCLYQRLMLGKGYFVRGGIANGLNMVDNNFIFSSALIKAVETEKETSYPRITLHKELRDIYLSKNDNYMKEFIKGQFLEDWAGHVFLNPFKDYEQTYTREVSLMPQEAKESIKDLFKDTTKKQKRLFNKLNNEFSDYFETRKFNRIARKIINSRIKKYKDKEQNIYEKYIWTNNLLNWIEEKPAELAFRFV